MQLGKRMGRACIICACLLWLLLGHAPRALAAENIMDASVIKEKSGFPAVAHLYDGMLDWGNRTRGGGSLTLETDTGIGSIYLIFAAPYDSYSIVNNENGEVYLREDPFLHDFVDLEAVFGSIPSSVTLEFSAGDLILNEMYVFSPGPVPDYVQKWKAPEAGNTDLILFTTHCDDEHLFFAGLLPYYSAELGYQVQVVYLTDHHNNLGAIRCREALDGLWAVGVDTYPVFGEFPDFYQLDLASAYYQFQWMGHSREELLGFVVEQLRRFQPKVAVGHDFAGEYGHGQHKVYADLLSEAVQISMKPALYPESAQRYGVWDVPKTYFHLYEENTIVMGWDRELEAFQGMTAYEVSIHRGFAKHVSQIEDFEWYYRGFDRASEVAKFNPCYFGLYRSTVGPDVNRDDFFENVTTHAADRLAQEQILPEPTEPEPIPTEAPEEAPPEPESAKKIPVYWLALPIGLGLVLFVVFRRRK